MNPSKILHITAMCCFLLPFFFNGCNSEKSSASTSKLYSDSTTLDSAKIKVEPVQKNDKSSLDKNENSEAISKRIVRNFPFLKPILLPGIDNISGIGLVFDCIPLVPVFAVFGSFLFLLFSLLVKFLEPKAIRFIQIFNLLALLFLAISKAPYSDSDPLWGYWLALAFVALLTLYDWFFGRTNKFFHIQNSINFGSNGE